MSKNLYMKRWRWIYVLGGFLLLATAAEKARQLVGEDAASKSGRFTWLNCFDMRSGSLACITKEGVKSYVYNIRAGHIARARQRSYEISFASSLRGGQSAKVATKEAKKAGAQAEKMASRQTRRMLGPISAALWDSFEALYFKGTLVEAVMRGIGTMGGTYIGGFQGEEALGRLGYFIGSHIGSWIGGRVGLMIYDISLGIDYLFQGEQMESAPIVPDDMSVPTVPDDMTEF